MAFDSKVGFTHESFDDIRAQVIDVAKQLISDDVGDDDTTLVGQTEGMIAYRDNILAMMIEADYYSRYALTAHGSTLDRIGADEYVFRKPAASAVVNLQVDGYVGGMVDGQAFFSTEDGLLFQTYDDIDFDKQSQIDDPDNPGKQIGLEDDNGEPLCRVVVQAIAEDAGIESNVGAGEITYNVDANENIFAITNPEAATGGQAEETDLSYAARIIASRIAGSPSTENGIQASIQNLPDVFQAKVTRNNTMQVNDDGDPAKTTHLYVIGGSDQEIANEYFRVLPLGQETVGAVSVNVVNNAGETRVIKFDRAKTVPIFVEIAIDTTDDFDTDKGVNNIKNNLTAFLANFKMGQTVLFSQLFGEVWKVPGISNMTLKIGLSKDAMALSDIDIDSYNIAVLSNENIEVTTNAAG
ncbi:baseplate J/gp47 family protein [Secundilactobacillus kimchicus]|uniref:baseplate J/gp47 family protein n=1 Tax=Secundilactobacillus kimchicus TaxID=528209 RepID=UPI0024A98018|nr:baseplate J/gp47 family protein [Secundilactobacillus kimchicus]